MTSIYQQSIVSGKNFASLFFYRFTFFFHQNKLCFFQIHWRNSFGNSMYGTGRTSEKGKFSLLFDTNFWQVTSGNRRDGRHVARVPGFPAGNSRPIFFFAVAVVIWATKRGTLSVFVFYGSSNETPGLTTGAASF